MDQDFEQVTHNSDFLSILSDYDSDVQSYISTNDIYRKESAEENNKESPSSSKSFFIENFPENVNDSSANSLQQTPRKFGVYINESAFASMNKTSKRRMQKTISKNNSSTTSINNLINDNIEKPFHYNSENGSSLNTISTKMLLSNQDVKLNQQKPVASINIYPENIESPDRVTSSLYSPLHGNHNSLSQVKESLPFFVEPREIYSSAQASLAHSCATTNSSNYYNDTIPAIDQAQQIRKSNVAKTPVLSISKSKFSPIKYNLKKVSKTESIKKKGSSLFSSSKNKLEQSSSRPSLTSPQPKSLLKNHLSFANDKIEGANDGSLPNGNKNAVQSSYPPSLPDLSYGNEFAESQIDLTLDTLQNFRSKTYRRYNIDVEAMGNLFQEENEYNSITGSYDGINDDVFEHIPIQHIDSNSIYNFDSEISGYLQIYSIWRILLVVSGCILVLPLFFIIGVGKKEKKIISDYKLMKMVLNKNHRIGLMKGFHWELDLQWLRTTFLILGVIETIAIMACIAVGFSVGITSE
ncbi:hypothetical protein TPHA_0F01060 [Tetrapisispora phaffii CBS 4417]|uniref:Uncharacterized protein n=1 Tax=Tetrapisispora phaffii (strain ATCC 24235 / CBS 4417 / NBRC 1672 / NRRL Y-8282 / UCD 70-5) TaxID=1071381 RepID=G8BV09_TETPH|nr:hypothetical protein TPHA_0F01060 [Tetrapisispora phaffii CBS 4417]CCE63591.1 hypothetical protein TPHA_0F01060 [Tetrapisispora phaffii CBS 4417]